MKFYTILVAAALCATPAFSETVIIQNQGGGPTTTRELPGNATIVTGGDGGPRGVYIENDDSILYRTLVDRDRYYGRGYRGYGRGYGNGYNAAPVDSITAACAGADRVVEHNRCIRDAIENQEELYRKYND